MALAKVNDTNRFIEEVLSTRTLPQILARRIRTHSDLLVPYEWLPVQVVIELSKAILKVDTVKNVAFNRVDLSSAEVELKLNNGTIRKVLWGKHV